MSVVRAAALLAVLLAGCLGGPTPTPTPARDCGVPGSDPVFNAWRQACSRGDPAAAGAPWATLPPGYSGFPAASSPSTPAPAIARSPSPALGPLTDGIPTTIDGAMVYVGVDAEQYIKHSTSAKPFLLGGWFHQGQPTVFCPAYLYGTRWGCNAWIRLYPDATRTNAQTIYPTDPPNLTAADLYGATRAIVLLVHTHDPGCPSDFKGCELLTVEDAIVWLGPAQP